MKQHATMGWVVMGLLGIGILARLSSNQANPPSTPSASDVMAPPSAVPVIAEDSAGRPIAPFSLPEPPPPTADATPEQRQVLSLHEQVLLRNRGGHRYNLACAYAVIGGTDAAIYWLQRAALEDGVDPNWARRDPDLERVRADVRGGAVLAYLNRMAQYFQSHPLDRQTLRLPSDYQVGKPVPMLIGMHGFGSVPEDFGHGFAEMANPMGMAYLSVSATKTRGPQSFVWAEDVESDKLRIERAMAAVSAQVTPAMGQIYLIGFSQGGQLALEIAAKYPERFAGAIAMSPGTVTDLAHIGASTTDLSGHRFVIVAGEKEHARTLLAASLSKQRLESLGAKVIYRLYPGVKEHSFPHDYFVVLPKWLAFLSNGTPIDAN